jgi:hypothetical protein
MGTVDWAALIATLASLTAAVNNGWALAALVLGAWLYVREAA